MSKKDFYKIILILLPMLVVSCIEVRDPATVDETAQVQEFETLEDFLIDEPMYLLEGKILTEKKINILEATMGRPLTENPSTIKLKFRKLTFTENGSLQIFSNDVFIEAEEIESNGGRIYTYPEHIKAHDNTPGRDGGHINFWAKFGSGRLFLDFIGEGGGDGVSVQQGLLVTEPPCDYRKGTAGANGQPGGKSGHIAANVENERTPFEMIVRPIAGKGGARENGVAGIVFSVGLKLAICQQRVSPLHLEPHHGQQGVAGEVEDFQIKIGRK